MANRAHSTPVSDVHPLTGSSTPGSVFPDFSSVSEMPSTFVSLGDAAADVVAGLAARRAASIHPDAELIDLAERVKALCLRHQRVELRVLAIQERLDLWSFANRPVALLRTGTSMVCERSKTDTHSIMVFKEPLEVDEQRTRDAADHQAAVDAHKMTLAKRREGTRAPYLSKIALRMWSRYVRWTSRLAGLAASTAEALAAKASVYQIVTKFDAETEWGVELARAVTDDAVRLGTTIVEALAQGTHLQRLRREHERVAPLRDAAYDAWTDAGDRFEQPTLPDALRFDKTNDASSIGSFQNYRAPFGYTDPRQIEVLRKLNYSRPEHRARRDKIVAAFDQWTAECLTARAAAGIDATSEHFWTLAEEASQLRLQMVNARAMSIDDLWHKVAVALECFDGVSGIEEEMAQKGAKNASGDALELSILLDLGRMLEAQDSARKLGASNIIPTTLPHSLVGQYPAHASRELVESYRAFLDMELRFLNWETHRSPDAIGGIWLDCPAGRFHGGDEPRPSTRAATVLGLLGLMPEKTLDDQPLAVRGAA